MLARIFGKDGSFQQDLATYLNEGLRK